MFSTSFFTDFGGLLLEIVFVALFGLVWRS